MLNADLDDTLATGLERAAREEQSGAGWAGGVPGSVPAVGSAALARSGALAAGELARWLGRAFSRGLAGRLWIAAGALERSFFLEAGRIVLVSSNHDQDRLGVWLVGQGRLTAEQRDRALAEARASERRLGAVLVDQGRLTSNDLLSSLRGHQEQLVVASMDLTEGVLGFDPELRADPRRLRLLAHPALLVRKGLTGVADCAPLWARLGGPGAVLSRTPGERARDVLEVLAGTEEDRRVLALFDGWRSSGAVAAASGWPEARFVALALAAQAFGLIAAVDVRPPRGLGRDRQQAGERLLARFALARAGDYFEFLGLDPGATALGVRRAVARVDRELAEVARDPEMLATLGDELTVVREVLDEAARVLGDERMRAGYRAALAAATADETDDEAGDDSDDKGQAG